MEKIALITDSACDLSIEKLKEYNIFLLPFRIIYKDREFNDRIDIDPDYVYSRLPGEIPTTSLPDVSLIDETFSKIEAEGYTHAICVSVSSAMSGTYNSVRLVAENHPNLKCTLFDSKTVCAPVGAITLAVARMIEFGHSFDEITDALPLIRKNVTGFYTIETLEYLQRGGRIGRVAGTLGEFFDIKPIISVSDDGVYYSYSKARGKKQAVRKLKKLLLDFLEKDKYRIIIMQTGDLAEATEFLNEIKDNKNVIDICISPLSPALGVHVGPGLLGFTVLKEHPLYEKL